MKYSRVKEHPCPYCGAKNSAAANPQGEETPKASDLAICFYCTQVGIYEDDLTVRKMTPEEEKSILRLPEVIRYRNFLKEIDRRSLPSA